MNVPRRLVRELVSEKRTVAVAESFTGGRVQDLLTNIPGVSRVYLGGIVAYADGPKRKHLGVDAAVLRRVGAVSPEVAIQMAQGARRLFKADVGIATTGIAGPTGATAAKPIGLSVVAVAERNRAVAESRVFHGSRGDIKDLGATQALELALRVLFPKPIRQPPRSRGT